MIPRCTVGKGITGAVRYILGEGNDPETGKPRSAPANGKSRVPWFGGIGFGFDIETPADADLARRMMEFEAQNQTSTTRPCLKDCVHLSLGWKPGETPTVSQMQEAAKEALAAIGMANARALFAIHTDEGYAHIHIVASKIDPATGRAYDLKSNYLKLSKWAEAYERTFSGGVVCTQRAENNELRAAVEKRNARGVLEVITKQRSTFTLDDLDRLLKKQIIKTVERKEFAAQIMADPIVVGLADEAGGGITRYTTEIVLEAEGHVLRASAGLAASRRHGIKGAVLMRLRQTDAFATMTAEQSSALQHATRAGGLALIDGCSGTGKSFTMAAIRAAYELGGYRVIGLAPTNVVAQDLQRGGFRHATTIHAELFALNSERTSWNRRTLVMVDEAAMVDTRLMAMLTAHAYASGAKLILVGDDRQLSSIDRGGMFGVLKERYGAARLTEVRRQTKKDERRATELMAEGNFHDALAHYESKGNIHWSGDETTARVQLVRRWAADSAAKPENSRFVFAYTNAEVDLLNRDLRQVRIARGELGKSTSFETKHGTADFAVGDRMQFTGTDKRQGIVNGLAGVIESIESNCIIVRLDGSDLRRIAFDPETFIDFRHGYAGTIYKGQGRTLNETYLLHSFHWRSAASYVALSRHRDKTELFVSRETARDLTQLARQMARWEERRAASHFFRDGEPPGPVRPLTPRELAAVLGRASTSRAARTERWRTAFRRTAREETAPVEKSSDSGAAGNERSTGKDKATGKGEGQPSTPGERAKMKVPSAKTNPLRALWRQVADFITRLCTPEPDRPAPRPGNNKRRPDF
jgi:hypothetical protein